MVVTIHQQAEIYASVLDAGAMVTHETNPNRKIFVQIVSGDLDVNGTSITSGDGIQLRDQDKIEIRADSQAEFLLFDLG